MKVINLTDQIPGMVDIALSQVRICDIYDACRSSFYLELSNLCRRLSFGIHIPERCGQEPHEDHQGQVTHIIIFRKAKAHLDNLLTG